MNVVLIIANSADLDEMQHHAAFHLGLHCLPKYLFRVSRKQWVYVLYWGLSVAFDNFSENLTNIYHITLKNCA